MTAYVTYGRAQRRAPRGGQWALLGLAAVTLFGVAACNKLGMGGGDEMSWARAALERNDRIEVVATDPATNTFTVRIKESGDLRTVRADQVIAAPPGLAVPAGGAAPAAASGTAEPSDSTASNAATAEAPAQATATEPAPAASASNSASPGAMASSTPSPAPAQANIMSSSIPRTGYQPATGPASEVPNPKDRKSVV